MLFRSMHDWLAAQSRRVSRKSDLMQAIGYANQLASQQANQLLQIRALLVAQQNALATRAQVDADKEAQRAAASKALRSGALSRSTDTGIRMAP